MGVATKLGLWSFKAVVREAVSSWDHSSSGYVSPTHQNHHHSCHTERESEYEARAGETELRDQELVILLEHFISACQEPELQLNNHIWLFSFISQKIFFFYFFSFSWICLTWFLSFAVKKVCTNNQLEVWFPEKHFKVCPPINAWENKEVRIGHSYVELFGDSWFSLSRSSALSSYTGQEI